jgi:hypothetical protein
VTLFHALPGHLDVAPELAAAADRPGFAVRVAAVQPLGRGAAYRIESGELAYVHTQLRAVFEPWLTPQDRQPYRPHVTVQNKVDPAVARETVARLRAAFVPHEVGAVGLALWRYAGGPWEPVSEHPFRG